MKLKLAYFGDPVLRKKGILVEEINEDIRQLVDDMLETMIEHNGIGLAAPQVHLSLRLFITAIPIEKEESEWKQGKLKVYINPEILAKSDETDIHQEGCLSIPKLYADVERPVKIRVRATDLDGNVFEEELEELECRCFLHENDHINGVLFIDRVKGKERLELDPKLKDIKKRFQK